MKAKQSAGRAVPQFLYAALAAVMLTHCEMARMRVDPALAGVTPLKVERSNWTISDKPLRFGDWHTTEKTIGWEKTRVNGFFVNHQKSEQPYHFALATKSGAITGDCIAAARFASLGSTQIDLAMLRGQPKFQCRYTGAAEGTLTLVEEAKLGYDALVGTLEFGADRWRVSTTSQIENSPHPNSNPHAGYELRRDNDVVASVQIINNQLVWMSPASSQLDQDRLAAAITSLLLYQPLEAMERE